MECMHDINVIDHTMVLVCDVLLNREEIYSALFFV